MSPVTAPLERARTRAAFTVVDQGLSSVSNFLLGIAVARAVSVDGYGAFAIAFSVYGVGLGVSRAFGTDPLLVRFSGASDEEQRRHGGPAIGAAVGLGLLVGAALAAFGLARPGAVGDVCLAFGLGLPVLFGHEAYRYALIGRGRAHLASVVDLAWIALFALALIATSLPEARTAAPFVYAWSGAGALAMALGAGLAGRPPRLDAAARWVGQHADLGPRFAAEFVVVSGASHVVVYLTGVIAGLDEGGALRGASVVLGPIWIVAAGLVAAAVPEGVRLHAHAPDALRRRVHLLAGGLAVVSVAWGLAASALPDGAGEAILGDTWEQTRPLLALAGFYGGGFVAGSGIVAGLRSLAAARRSFAASIPTGLLVIAGGALGAAVGDARGALVGMLVPSWLGAAALALQFRRALAEAAPTP